MSSSRRTLRVAATVLIGLVVLAGREAKAAFPGQPGRIAFVRQGPQGGIYTMEPSGADVSRLTSGQDYRPRWSPDGTRIVFQRFDGSRSFLWVMDADGSDLAALGVEGFHPAWSPDGERIAFGCGQRTRHTEICVARADGSDQQQLTHDEVADSSPAWSPDGTRIAYVHGSRPSNLYVMDANGSDQSQVTRNEARDLNPDWSPDGSTLAFYSLRHDNVDLFTIQLDGSGLQRITHGPGAEWAPAWSPDGARIAFTASYRRGRQDIAVLSLAEPFMVRFIAIDTSDFEPDWQAL